MNNLEGQTSNNVLKQDTLIKIGEHSTTAIIKRGMTKLFLITLFNLFVDKCKKYT